MLILIVYDVGTADAEGQKRLRRVARACEDYGQRVQKSVFECRLGDAELALIKGRLLDVLDSEQDSIRIYYLDSDVRVEHFGTNKPLDMTGPLVI